MKYLRFVILAVAVLGTCTTYLARTCITVALVYMVPDEEGEGEESQGDAFNETTTSSLGKFFFPELEDLRLAIKRQFIIRSQQLVDPWATFKNSTGDVDCPTNGTDENLGWLGQLSQKQFDYSETQQGLLLSAFFGSYILLQVLAGSYAKRYGPKWFLVVSLIGSTTITFLTPFIADFIWIFICSRILLGFLQSAWFPSGFVLVMNWMPKSDQTFAIAALNVGSSLGAILTFFASDYIVRYLSGWASIFFVYGFSCLALLVVVLLFITSYPDEHPFISPEELETIKDRKLQNTISRELQLCGSESINCRDSNKIDEDDEDETEEYEEPKGVNMPIPWSRLLTNPPFLVTVLFRFSNGCTFILFYTEMSHFLKLIVHEDASNNGFVNAMIQLSAAIAILATGYISERIIEWGLLSRTNTRRVFGAFCGGGQSIGVLIIPFVGKAGLTWLHIVMYTIAAFLGFSAAADNSLPAEMTKHFGPQLYAILNIISVLPGLIFPNIIAQILNIFSYQPEIGWNIVFYMFASLSATATFLFVSFVSAERQPFDYRRGSIMPRSKSHSLV